MCATVERMTRSPRLTFLTFLTLTLCGGCEAELSSSGRDAGSDADAGAGTDAGADAGADSGPGMDAGATPDAGADAGTPDAGPPGAVIPPLGGSSRGTGGGAAGGEERTTGSGVSYRLVVPASYREGTPNGLLVVYSGTEGAAAMTMNLSGAGPSLGLGDLIYAVLDGRTYFGDGAAGASVLDAVRAAYDIDNDRTFLLSESAGTSAGLQLGFDLRQSYFAAYWANDVNASATPSANATALGFAPFGNAGPGGDFANANAIVAGMRSAGYRIADPAPYDGPGAGTHGDSEQFIAALRWFVGRSRR